MADAAEFSRVLRDAYEARSGARDDLTLCLEPGLSPEETEAATAALLAERLAAGECYTAIGDVLVAVNPFEVLEKPAGVSTYDAAVGSGDRAGPLPPGPCHAGRSVKPPNPPS